MIRNAANLDEAFAAFVAFVAFVSTIDRKPIVTTHRKQFCDALRDTFSNALKMRSLLVPTQN